MIVKLSEIKAATVRQSPITGEKYVVIRKGKEVARIALER